MTLNQTIAEYRKMTLLFTAAEATGGNKIAYNQQKNQFFNQVNNNISALINDNTADVFSATLLFSEMALRKVGDFAPLLAYYYGSLSMTSSEVQPQHKIDAQRMRLFALFQHLDKFDRFITLAHTAPMMEYEGNLSMEQFFDFLIMSDAYQVWRSDNESAMLNSIKRLVNQHKANHPTFSKERIIFEGKIAHEALMSAIKYALQKF